ncbi:hypothetical protein [Budvicia aquatica]|uniref:hypothetical protein n=1 Tax=Budvicia aquatica TaxID=82979 RepID=UPI002101BABD|nr:hypothetical protein [Budvicia aquatica]
MVKQANRSVGLNVQSLGQAAENTELTVRNSGDIIVNGSSSVGMRVSGLIRLRDYLRIPAILTLMVKGLLACWL